MKQKKICLAIAENHHAVLDGLLSVLHKHNDFKVVIITATPEELLDHLACTQTDIILADYAMLHGNNYQLVKKIKTVLPKISLIAMVEEPHTNEMSDLAEAGLLAGFIIKNNDMEAVMSSIKNITTGMEPVEKTLPVKPGIGKEENTGKQLTGRELEIIRLIEQEYNNKQIAERLFISERTVETHRKNIFRKTKTNNVIGLIKYAYEHKLV